MLGSGLNANGAALPYQSAPLPTASAARRRLISGLIMAARNLVR